MSNQEESLPREFGKYHLIEKIASGGMAELYRAKLYGAGGFEKDLAIKKVLPQLARDESFIQMFMDEAMITVTLSHGNIVSVIDFGELAGEYYLVMEYVDGVSLQNLIKKSQEIGDPLPVPIACYIALLICQGLDYAHRKVGPDGKPQQIVHRDISPQNILISFEGEVKIVDFGIARAQSRITSTQAGVVKGKVAYMSPEQLTGHNVDNRSDIFSVAIILYEMLTNRRPFEGNTPQETMAQISRGNYQKPHKLNRKVDKRLAAVIGRGLERNSKKRYKTAGEMAADLSSYLHRSGLRPDPAEVAAFIPKRLPDARPRTMPPTPIRAIRRGPTAPSPSVQVNEQELHSQPDHFPVPVPAPAPAPAPEEAQQEQVVVDDGEAVSFGDLGLPPQYEPEDSRRPTDPERPKAAAGPPAPSILTAETRLLPQSRQSQPADSEHVDPDLLSAATMLLTAQQEPELPSVKRTQPPPAAAAPASEAEPGLRPGSTRGEPSPPAGDDEDIEASWMQKDEKAAEVEPVAAPAVTPKPAPRRSVVKLITVAGAALVVVAVALFILLRPTDRPEEPKPVEEAAAAPAPAAVLPEPSPPPAPAPVPAAEPSETEPAGDPALAPIETPAVKPPPPKKVAKPKRPKTQKKKKKPPEKKPKEVAITVPESAGRETGTLRINSEPFAVIYLGKKSLGPTPQMNIKLPAGSHTLTLKNDALGIVKSIRVRIEAGKVHTVFVELQK